MVLRALKTVILGHTVKASAVIEHKVVNALDMHLEREMRKLKMPLALNRLIIVSLKLNK